VTITPVAECDEFFRIRSWLTDEIVGPLWQGSPIYPAVGQAQE
jgi:hypothetical protein